MWRSDKDYYLNSSIYDDYERGYDENGFLLFLRKKGNTNGKPSEIYFYDFGDVDCIYYYKGGKLHRDDDKPAELHYSVYGNLVYEGYYQDGELHRDGDKPAEIFYNDDGSISAEKYYKNGKEYFPKK